MKIIKRNGSEAEFDRIKIKKAIEGANAATSGQKELTDRQTIFPLLSRTIAVISAEL